MEAALLHVRARAVRGGRIHSRLFKLPLRPSFSTCHPYRQTEAQNASSEYSKDTLLIRRIETTSTITRHFKLDKSPTIKYPSSTKANPTAEYVQIGDFKSFHPVFIRDSCICPLCVDPSTKQKNFQTTDIPTNIKAKSAEVMENKDVKITWENDIPGFDVGHVSEYTEEFFNIHSSTGAIQRNRSHHIGNRLWNGKRIRNELEYINFDDYMKNDESLYRALQQLQLYGLLLLREVPESETSVEQIAGRIGNIRDTFYGRTWDVKSVPEAKNVAYTHQFLGLHMDLLYMTNPPGFQLLHCLKNTCEGGASLFSDSFYSATVIPRHSRELLSKVNIAFQYRNAGQHYYFRHPVIELSNKRVSTPVGSVRQIKCINYSPPFQAPLEIVGEMQTTDLPYFLSALRSFANRVESEENLLEYRLQEGECVLFNNRRVLHGRRAFEADVGERWLKGTYVDTDVLMSRFRVLHEALRADSGLRNGKGKLVFEATEQEKAERDEDKQME